jgi:hypothetical protein
MQDPLLSLREAAQLITEKLGHEVSEKDLLGNVSADDLFIPSTEIARYISSGQPLSESAVGQNVSGKVDPGQDDDYANELYELLWELIDWRDTTRRAWGEGSNRADKPGLYSFLTIETLMDELSAVIDQQNSTRSSGVAALYERAKKDVQNLGRAKQVRTTEWHIVVQDICRDHIKKEGKYPTQHDVLKQLSKLGDADHDSIDGYDFAKELLTIVANGRPKTIKKSTIAKYLTKIRKGEVTID